MGLTIFFTVAAAVPANAQEQTAEDRTTVSAGSLGTRPHLTGDWWGARSYLDDHGFTLDLRYTSFYQGLASGTGDKGFDYGGKFDVLFNLDSGKMGLWKGGRFRSHLEFSHGDLETNLGGAIFATNTAIYWPVDTPERVVATSLFFTQKVGDQGSIWLGKLHPLDLYEADPFLGGWGIDRFMNLAVGGPPSGLVPVVFMGAIAMFSTGSVRWTAIVGDPNDRTNDYFPGDLFEDGVNFGLSGAHTTTLSGRETTLILKGLFSTAEGTDYSSIGGIEDGTTTKAGSYSLNVEFKHNLQESGGEANATWGLYMKAIIADGNPNYVKRALIAGIGGRPLFFGRPQDTFGLGGSYYNLSDVLEEALEPSTSFGDAATLEAYYNCSLTPWLFFGPNLQYLKPPFGEYDNALVMGLRSQIRF